MSSFYRSFSLFAVLISITVADRPACGQVAGAKVKIYRLFTSQLVERVLNDMNANYTRLKTTSGSAKFYYSVKTLGNRRMYLHITHNGRMLWTLGRFREISYEWVNKWNQRTAISRALREYSRTTGKTTSVVEWQLDAGGGTTEALIRGFIITSRGFVDEFGQYTIDGKLR